MDRSPVAALVLCPLDLDHEKLNATANGPAQPIAGVSMLEWVVDAAVGASIRRISVVGLPPASGLASAIAQRSDMVLIDAPPAAPDPVETVARAIDRLGSELTIHENAHLLLLPSDIPQVSSQVLRKLIDAHVTEGVAATVLPTTFGGDGSSGATPEPIVTFDDFGEVASIIEPLQSPIDGTAAVVCVRASLLLPALRRVTPQSWNRELLIDDALATLGDAGHDVRSFDQAAPLSRVTSARDRALVEVELRDRIIVRWLDRGVSMPDPRRVSIDATVELGTGVKLLPGTVLEGMTHVGDDSVLGPNTHVIDARIGAEVTAPNVAIRDVDIAAHSTLEPFSVHGPRSGA